jgi:hypothetical protein
VSDWAGCDEGGFKGGYSGQKISVRSLSAGRYNLSTTRQYSFIIPASWCAVMMPDTQKTDRSLKISVLFFCRFSVEKVKIGKELKNACSFFCRKKNQKRLFKTLLTLYKVFWRYLFYKKGNKEF